MPKREPEFPSTVGEKWNFKGMVFEFTGCEKIKNEAGENDFYIFKNKKYRLKYHPLNLLNDMAGGSMSRLF